MLRVQMILVLLSLGFMFSLSALKSSHEPPAGALLLVVNKGEQTLGIVSPGTDEQLAAVPEGGITGHEVAASPDGRTAYVPIYGNSGVGRPGTDGRNMVVIDIDARKVAQLEAERRHLFEMQLRQSGFLLVDGSQPAPATNRGAIDAGPTLALAAPGEAEVSDAAREAIAADD